MSRNDALPSRLIAVLGSTGTVGTELVRQLAEQDCAVRGVLRQPASRLPVPPQDRPARVSYVLADYSSESQLHRALRGAEALFLLVGTNPDQLAIESRAIDAARSAGVRRIVKLSAPIVGADAEVTVAGWHREIEAKLAASGLEYCCLRPYAFMQNWLRNTHTIQQFGAFVGSAGVAARNYVDCRDVAAIAVNLLLSDAPLPRAITITGPEAITNQDVAERLSAVTGAHIRYENLTHDDHYRLLTTQAKLPEWLAKHIVELEALAVSIPEPTTSTVNELLNRAPRTMDEFLYEHRAAFLRRSPDQESPTKSGAGVTGDARNE